MDQRPPPDPAKLLAHWNEWERGETPPGRTMSNLKTGGLPELLQQLIDSGWQTAPGTEAGVGDVPEASTQRP